MSAEAARQLTEEMLQLIKAEKRVARKRQQAEGALVRVTARSIGDWHCLQRHPDTGEWRYTSDPCDGLLDRQGSVSSLLGPFQREIILADPDGEHFYRIAVECIVEIREVEDSPALS